MNSKKLRIGIIVLVIAFVAGCATFGDMTKEQQYLATRTSFNEILTQYIDFQQLQTPEKRAEIKAEVQPVLDEAVDALDLYKKSLTVTGDDPQLKLDFYLSVKNKLISLLLKYGLKVDEKGATQ